MCDNLVSLRKTDLTHFLGSLSRSKLADLNKSLIDGVGLVLGLTAGTVRTKSRTSGNARAYTRDGRCGALGQDLSDAANLRAYTFEFFFDVFVAAVDVVHAVDDRLTFRHQRCQHQRSRSPQIGRQHRRRAQRRWCRARPRAVLRS